MNNTDFNFSEFLIGDDSELEFNPDDFDITESIKPQVTRYIKPKFYGRPAVAEYMKAQQMASEIHLAPGEQFHAIVKGDFIFGDLIEALVYEKDVYVENMYLSTLSLSQNNIDSLAGMIRAGRIENMTLVLSNYFYSHEKNGLIPYLFESMDVDNRLDLLILRNHTKICLMEISNLRLIMSGSANLRSSESIEQFILQEDGPLYEFYRGWFEENRQHSVINREVGYGEARELEKRTGGTSGELDGSEATGRRAPRERYAEAKRSRKTDAAHVQRHRTILGGEE